MRLRSSIVAAVEAPPPEQILAPTEVLADSFDFLALPEEIRMCVYHHCLVSNTEISLDEGKNIYYILNYANNLPSANIPPWAFLHIGQPVPPAPPVINVNVPNTFLYPPSTNTSINFVPAGHSVHSGLSSIPQIIPPTSVCQPADLSKLPAMPVSSKDPFSGGAGIFIGPCHTENFSYIPPCQYAPPAPFNARILQTCKTIYTEALPVLYSKNEFVLHSTSGHEHFFKRFIGSPLTHLAELRLEVMDLGTVLDAGGSGSLWSTVLRRCNNLRKLALSFHDDNFFFDHELVKLVIRAAASAADVKKGTGEPVLTVKMKLVDSSALWGGANWMSHVFSRKTHPKMQLPRGPTIELMGKLSIQSVGDLQAYTRKGWQFRRTAPENAWDVEAGSWIELEWVKS
jgi:hypothetical protein